MLCFPNAKINLGLHVLNKRSDGYHNLETLFYPIPLKEALEIIPSESNSFHHVGLPLVDPDEENIIQRVINRLKERFELPPLAIYLKKAIPLGAGLGGGSSDAAFSLKMINSLAQLGLTDDELETIAATIGADVPFFIRNRAVIASGIGDRMTPVPLTLQGYHLLVVKPKISISTKEAYASITPGPSDIPLHEVISQPLSTWRETMVNDFEVSIFRQYPMIREIKEQLYSMGALFAAMSGSGSSVYGLFDKKVNNSFPDCFNWSGILE